MNNLLELVYTEAHICQPDIHDVFVGFFNLVCVEYSAFTLKDECGCCSLFLYVDVHTD